MPDATAPSEVPGSHPALAEPRAALRLLLGGAPDALALGGQAVLLDHEPAGVTGVAQRGEEPVEVDVALTEGTERTEAPQRRHAATVPDGICHDVEVHVLEVNVVHALVPVGVATEQVAAPAHREVPGVER